MSTYTYTFTFKKGDVFLEYVTTNKESMERQFQIWVTCASVWAYNQEKIAKGLMPAPERKEEKTVIEEPEIKPYSNEIIEEDTNEVTDTVEIQPQDEIKDDIPVEAEIIITNEQDEIDRESQRIIQEYKAEMEAEARKKETDAKKEEFKQNVENYMAQNEAVQEELSSLYDKKETIKDIEERQPEETLGNINSDFDSLLQQSMSRAINDVKEKRDERFLKVIKVKNVTEKIDMLIVTAYYLSEFERLDRFTLKLVNAKLMENLDEIVDSSVLQDAINQGLVECLPNYTNIPSATEYRLTEAGEEAFLNGRKND